MLFELVGLKIYFIIKHHKLLLETFLVLADIVFFLKMDLQSIVVNVVLLICAGVATVTNEATLMALPAVLIQFIC